MKSCKKKNNCKTNHVFEFGQNLTPKLVVV